MAQLRATGPYIWVTWLPRLLSGGSSCEWSSWFKAQHEGGSWARAPSAFDQVSWQMAHTAAINESRRRWEERGYTVFTENQNWFCLGGRSAALGGKPDLIARRGDAGTIIDVKTGRPSPAHSVQVMLYMYAVPRVLRQYHGVTFDGVVAYGDHQVAIPAAAVDETFIGNLAELVQRLSAGAPARRVPSPRECGFCDITSADCPERVVEDAMAEGVTEDF
jgi:hypothetical protein